MEKKVIRVDQRTVNTKHSVRNLRKQGIVPGVLYGQKVGSIPISVKEKDLTGLGGAHLVEVLLPGGSYNAIVREVQREPIHRHIRHIDLQQVDLDTKIRTEIPVSLIGEAKGAKEGGVVQAAERRLEVEGYPGDLPEVLEVDISGLEAGGKLTVRDLPQDLPVKILNDPDTILAVVVSARAAVDSETIEEQVPEGAEEAEAENEREE